MAPDWPLARLGDVADLLTGYPFRSESYVDDVNAPRLLRGDNVAQGRLRWDGAKRWPAGDSDDLAKYKLREGDVVLAMDRPWIEAGLKYASVSSADLPALLVQRVARLRGTEALDTCYLKYVIGSPAFTEYVLAVQTGTAVPHISSGQIKSFEFRLPSLAEQRTIARALGALDDKIELNRRMCETLEAMARALFKSWFVDFEPVRKKIARCDQRRDASSAGLFPSLLVDSPLGPVPEGWRATTWGELVTLEYGRSLRGHGDEAGRYPVFGTNGQIGRCSTPLCGHPGIIIGRKGAHRTIHFSSEPFYVIDTAFYVEPRCAMEFRWAFYELLRHDINGMDTGSAIPSTSRGDFYALPVLQPPLEVQVAFSQILSPIWAGQKKAKTEAAVLAEQRDALLPWLMSDRNSTTPQPP